jgi:hypothetical protein
MKQTKLEERVSYKACLFIQQEKKKTKNRGTKSNSEPQATNIISWNPSYHINTDTNNISILLKKKTFCGKCRSLQLKRPSPLFVISLERYKQVFYGSGNIFYFLKWFLYYFVNLQFQRLVTIMFFFFW